MSIKRIGFAIFMLLLSFSIFATQIIKSDVKKIVTDNLNEPYIFAGNDLDFNGKADDLFAIGSKINFTGETKYDVMAIGSEINVNGKVGHNLVSAANNVDVKGTVNGTVFLAGDTVVIDKDTVINGAVFTGARFLKILGKINGDLYAGTARVTINGEINGNVKVYTGKLSIDTNGKINGNVFYKSEWQMSKDELAKISGTVKFEKAKTHFNDLENSKGEFFHRDSFRHAMGIFSLVCKIFMNIAFIIGGLLLLLFPAMKKLEEERTSRNILFTGLWGLIPFFIYPAVTLFLLIVFPLFFVMLSAALPLLLITHVIGVTLTGQLFFNLFKWNKQNRFLYFLFGLILFLVLSFIPVINGIAFIIYSSLGWGLILEGLFRKKLA